MVRAFLDHHPDAVVRLENHIVNTELDEWCTNDNLKYMCDFSLSVGDRVVLLFYDHPDALMAPWDQLGLVEKLAEQRLLRFRILHPKPSLLQRLFGKNELQ